MSLYDPLVAALDGETVGNISLPSGSPAACVDAMIEARMILASTLGAVEALSFERTQDAALAALLARLNAAYRQPLFDGRSA